MELVKIELGTSLFYYIYLLACFGVFLGLYFGLRKKSKKVQKWVLFGVLAFNFVLHFVKQSFPEYLYEDYYVTGTLVRKAFPAILRKCTPENICAVSTLIFPFIFLSNWKTGKDYMFYLGTISGLLGCFAPMPAFGLPFYSPEAIRCFICHASLWQVPILMVVFGLHKLDYRRNWRAITLYFVVLCVIMVNELILIRVGWVETATFEEFFDASGRDMGYAVGYPPQMQKIANFLLFLTPKAWRHIPILWELFPAYILGGLYTIFLCAYWEHEHIRQDLILVIDKVKAYREKRRAKKAGGAEITEEITEENKEEESQKQDDTE